MMTSKPKSQPGDLARSRLPRARICIKSKKLSSFSPIPTPTPPAEAASTRLVSMANILLAPVSSKTPVTKTEPSPAICALKAVLEGLRSSLNGLPPLQLAVGGLLGCIVHAEVKKQNQQAYDELAADLANLGRLLRKHVVESNPRSVPHSIANLARAITEQTNIIEKHQNKSKISRLVLALEDEEAVLKCYRRIGTLFQQLQADISSSIWDIVLEQQMDITLERLSPAHDACHNAALPTSATKRAGCTEGTRVNLLSTTQAWTRQEDAQPIYWLNGMAGTGKTTIAYTLCELLEKNQQLAASFFCSRNSPNCRDVNRIVPTIAYQLAQFSNPYRKALCGALRDNPDAAKRKIGKQFETLVSRPLAEIGKAMPTDVVVVIDALDECEDVDGTREVLNMLLRCAGDLPIKFFVSSRPEPAISTSMRTSGGAIPLILRLHDIEKSLVQEDIKLYLTEALSPLQITPSELDQLVTRCGCLFIFAATSVRYIIPSTGPVDHRQRLEAVLKLDPSRGHKSCKDVDRLYTTILLNAFDDEVFEREELELTQLVLWTVVCAREPLTISALAEILNVSDDQAIVLAIQPLQSVLHVSEGTGLISTLHASFPDFLSSQERAGKLYCDMKLHELDLAERCFTLMDRLLHFNICDLKSSYKFDKDIPDLQEQVAQKISTGLFYVCRYWSEHLTRNPPTPPLLSLIESFLESRLLFWMEVLSLQRMVGHGEAMLSQVLTWLPAPDENTRLHNFTYDARNFFTSFASNPTSFSTPHIYVSALPFTSKQSLIHSTYWPRTQGLIQVEGGAMDTSSKSALASWAVGWSVNCLALSNNGRHVACGSDGSRVSAWDISSGTCTLGPLESHQELVSSVAYSPNDAFIASCSRDHTICIWDAYKGSLTSGPLRGHTAMVNSVAFSRDGVYLASGSYDQTIRFWNVRSGAPVGEPLEGHWGAVYSIVFSPDREHLASGSEDSIIRVWDWRKRLVVQRLFEKHTGAVRSVAYSSDGCRLVSGSADGTVRVWDASKGALLVGPFEGHTDLVSCVSFSLNGTRVVSGSHDKTVCVWDAISGALVARPFEGHGQEVNSVLFTTDGTHILSGSYDGTIRVWDARQGITGATQSSRHTGSILSIALSPDGTRAASGSSDQSISVWNTHNGALVAGPFIGHTDIVLSVAFSPDGARIVSGSADRTLRTWDASTGVLLVGPIEGHTDSVESVAFSPDGSRIASGSWDATIRLWDSHNGKHAAELKGLTSLVAPIAFSPSGSRMVFGSWDDKVRMWDSNNGKPVWTSSAHTRLVRCVAFSPDGTRVVSGSDDRTILVLDAHDGAVLHEPFIGHTCGVMSVAFSPDGTRIASGSWDQTVRVWDVESGVTVVGPLKGYTSRVHFVAFSPDPGLDPLRIISADGKARIWDLAAVAQANGSNDWSIDENGWLIDSQSKRLFWIPSDLRSMFGFLTPSTPIVINASCTTRIESSTLLGDRWRDCWRASSALS